MGGFAGYFSTRAYRMFRGTNIVQNAVRTALVFPGTVFLIYFILNMFQRGVHSSGAVPFSTLVALVALWLGISMPLVFFGSYLAKRKKFPEHPVSQVPRQIPKRAWHKSSLLFVLVGGLVSFSTVFIEFFFILFALWGNHMCYIYGFVTVVFILLSVTCVEVAMVVCYYQLSFEDYNWMWRSFLTTGSSALYMFLYSIFYFSTNLDIEKFVSVLIYFGYTSIISIAFFVLTGSIGFYACLLFVRKIYSSIQLHEELGDFANQREKEELYGTKAGDKEVQGLLSVSVTQESTPYSLPILLIPQGM